MEKHCIACGGTLEPGIIRSGANTRDGRYKEPIFEITRPVFVRPGVPVSANPITAFVQGLHQEPDDQYLALQAYRCAACGHVELFADEA